MYRDHSRCRACNTHALTPAFDLGVQPLANDFKRPGEDRAGFAPLSILYCKECSLAQLSVVVNHHILYDHYSYVTSPSETMKHHFEKLLYDIGLEAPTGTVLEIGSNDGRFLETCKNYRYGKVVGIDPAENLASEASQRGIKTITDVFDLESAKDAKNILGEVDIIIARHVFAHVDDWSGFITAIENVSHPETLICIECPYCIDMLDQNEWDTIYHEHLSYVTVKAVQRLLTNTSLHLHKIIRYGVHGGSIVMMLRKDGCSATPHVSVEDYIEKENQHDLLHRWREFGIMCKKQRAELTACVFDLISSGKTVIGFGASAKATVAINACSLNQKDIRFVTDITPHKHGRMIPGTGILVFPEERLYTGESKHAICFAWNFKDEILRKHKAFRDAGGKFIFFVPNLEIV